MSPLQIAIHQTRKEKTPSKIYKIPNVFLFMLATFFHLKISVLKPVRGGKKKLNIHDPGRRP